jgi:fructose-specific component phosphotransferase system IIB-like protein
MSKTKHLDGAIAALSNKASAKRAARKAQVNIVLYDLGATGASVQVNGKEVWLAPDMARARADADNRKSRAQALGKTVNIEEF